VADLHPELPTTPEEIAHAADEAARAGAAVVHVHVREPDTGKPSRRPELFREVVERIRERNDRVLINLTTGVGGDLFVGERGAEDTPAAGSDFVGALERLVHVEELRPDICTLDCGSMNFWDPNYVYIAPVQYLRVAAARIKELGVKPELEVFDLGHLRIVHRLIADELVASPPFIQICLGIDYGAPADTVTMQTMVDKLPEGSVWSSFGTGRLQMPMAAQAAILGGNIRVGLEDNLYLTRGVFATNGQLVESAVQIVERLGGRVADSGEVQRRLDIAPPIAEAS
jgi:uncharacterized protein (DUF849 family)